MPDAHSALAAPGSEDSPQNGRSLGNLHFAYQQSVVYAAAATGVMPRSWKRVRIWMRGSRSRGPPGSRRRACVPCGAAGAGEHRADDLVAEREQGGDGAGSAGRDAVAAGLAGLDSKALPAEPTRTCDTSPTRPKFTKLCRRTYEHLGKRSGTGLEARHCLRSRSGESCELLRIMRRFSRYAPENGPRRQFPPARRRSSRPRCAHGGRGSRGVFFGMRAAWVTVAPSPVIRCSWHSSAGPTRGARQQKGSFSGQRVPYGPDPAPARGSVSALGVR